MQQQYHSNNSNCSPNVTPSYGHFRTSMNPEPLACTTSDRKQRWFDV